MTRPGLQQTHRVYRYGQVWEKLLRGFRQSPVCFRKQPPFAGTVAKCTNEVGVARFQLYRRYSASFARRHEYAHGVRRPDASIVQCCDGDAGIFRSGVDQPQETSLDTTAGWIEEREPLPFYHRNKVVHGRKQPIGGMRIAQDFNVPTAMDF